MLETRPIAAAFFLSKERVDEKWQMKSNRVVREPSLCVIFARISVQILEYRSPFVEYAKCQA